MRQCWLDSAVHGDSAGGRGLANGALVQPAPDPQGPRCASSRAQGAQLGACGSSVLAFWWQRGAQEGQGGAMLRPRRACLQLIDAGRSAPPVRQGAPHSTAQPRIAWYKHQLQKWCAREGAGQQRWRTPTSPELSSELSTAAVAGVESQERPTVHQQGRGK